MSKATSMYGEVVSTTRLSPQLVRIVLGGEGLADYVAGDAADQYVNCQFRPADAPYAVPFTEDEVRDLDREQRPFPRRITVRHWAAGTRELTLDIAVHGDVGHAGRWALAAQPGDRLQMRGPAGSYHLHQDAATFLLVGDESALPAIAASAEAAPAGSRVVVVAEVEDADGEIELNSPGTLEVHWVHRAGYAGDLDTLLAETVAGLRFDGVVSAFVHGEAEETRAVRRHLLSTGVVDLEHLSCSPYWRRGHDDEQWRTIKGAWTREVAADV
ncbi:siderophore-interacting protein [Nocardioides sp. Bht2]|uniref:siderophore-interacting protein n=1 Tax=Nocardioides sp. Bht2 TaxID=3392297 RepID=UPI0039B51D60